MTRRRWLTLAGTIAIAAAGGGLATLAGMPASWLSGSMIAVTIASLAGLNTRPPVRLIEVVFLLIGAALGSGVTPELVRGVLAWPLSLAGLVVAIVACVVGVRAFLMRVAGWDRQTAFFSALPGALSYVLALASETNADIRKVAASQSIRVFLLVAALPPVILAVEGELAAAAPMATSAPWEIVAVIAAAIAGGLLFRWIGIPAGLLTGAMAGSAILHGTGLVTGALPAPIVIAAFVLLGTLIGSRFVGTDLRFLASILLASIGAFVVATGIALAVAIGVAAVTGVPTDQAIVAFAPGGLDAMMSLSLALNMDFGLRRRAPVRPVRRHRPHPAVPGPDQRRGRRGAGEGEGRIGSRGT